MKIAIMQPYFFPYIGYFQLINCVDTFVFYDDVNYIKNGWIDRNKILVNQKEFLFKIPLSHSSSFKKINETLINSDLYESWVDRFLVTLEQSYKKAPFFYDIYPLILGVLKSDNRNLSELAKLSIVKIANYLEIPTKFVSSSSIYANSSLERTERLLDICKIEGASNYYNSIGGVDLYNPDDFEKQNISLKFLSPYIFEYKQFKPVFTPYLSIIDVLMFNDIETIKNCMLKIN